VKLLILYETVYPDFIGGVELRNHELAAALARRGHEVTLAGLCGSLTTDLPNLRILSLGELGGRLYNVAGKRSTRQALRFAAKVVTAPDLAPYDVVETANMPYIHLLPLALRCAVAGKPLLVTWHEYWGPYWRGYVGRLRAPAYRAVEWLTAQLGAAVIAVSELTRGRLAAARLGAGGGGQRDSDGAPEDGGGGGAGAIHLVPNGIAVARVRAAAAGGIAEASRPDAAPPLIYAGRLLEHKRLEVALRAVQILAQGGVAPPMAGLGAGPLLTIFGEGPDRARLERLAGELGIAGRVVFRGHVQTSAEVWLELGRARIAVQPSAREGFGLFPLEAMAAGLPVVYCASSESAVPELVRDGVEGIAVAAEPTALAGALAALLAPQGEEERQRLSRNALVRAAQYDWDEVARRVEEICLGLTARRRR
jgi:glycosyltransferase involved in cell wall biosynthesis